MRLLVNYREKRARLEVNGRIIKDLAEQKMILNRKTHKMMSYKGNTLAETNSVLDEMEKRRSIDVIEIMRA